MNFGVLWSSSGLPVPPDSEVACKTHAVCSTTAPLQLGSREGLAMRTPCGEGTAVLSCPPVRELPLPLTLWVLARSAAPLLCLQSVPLTPEPLCVSPLGPTSLFPPGICPVPGPKVCMPTMYGSRCDCLWCPCQSSGVSPSLGVSLPDSGWLGTGLAGRGCWGDH